MDRPGSLFMPATLAIVIHLKRCVIWVTQSGTTCNVETYVLILKYASAPMCRQLVSFWRQINGKAGGSCNMEAITATLSGCFERAQGRFLPGTFVAGPMIGMDSAPSAPSAPEQLRVSAMPRWVQFHLSEPGTLKPEINSVTHMASWSAQPCV